MGFRVQYAPNKYGAKGFRVTNKGVRVIDPRPLHPDNQEKGIRGREDWPQAFTLVPRELKIRIGQKFLVWEPTANAWIPAIITVTGNRDGESDQ